MAVSKIKSGCYWLSRNISVYLSSSFHWERTAKATSNATAGINAASEPNVFILILFSELILKRRAQECVYSRKKKKSPILEPVSVSQVLFMLQSWLYLMRHDNVILNLSTSPLAHSTRKWILLLTVYVLSIFVGDFFQHFQAKCRIPFVLKMYLPWH